MGRTIQSLVSRSDSADNAALTVGGAKATYLPIIR